MKGKTEILDSLDIETSNKICRNAIYHIIGYLSDGGVLTKEMFDQILERNIDYVIKR